MNGSNAGPETVDSPSRCPVAGRTPAEDGSSPSYGDLLRLDDLLGLPPRYTDLHDEELFYVAHMVYELWFKIVLDELERTRDALFADDAPDALYSLRRVGVIERVLAGQVDVLRTISPGSFALLRPSLYQASGIQSVQFREIEFLSGLKDSRYVERGDLDAAERTRLRRRMAEPTLYEAFLTLCEKRGEPDLTELLRAETPASDVLAVAEALLDHDELFSTWRARHVLMVERVIGAKAGTGGSSGAQYLRSTLEKRFFPELWELRTRL
ncbi:tryptophan 2,3-dioxygenase [Streptomyces sp. RKND-216]|uniref:tryptophan 2,3-dioxygenase family protein n=1 Tax=Streptomyces sp. RKND-216 TaxID=2562581 RepID=UPI00109D8CED|nr:tryptophan 2,3-dioxygenase family protein [Streptomyces sp. RKND-216]THA23584.1 tryptophan 2,3-dioxygenase [Streptomyces sp. RKND-216]